MAFSYYTYTGDGTTTQFPVAFGYIRREHVLATVAGAPATFTFVNSTTIQMTTAPANGAVVRVYRQTPLTAPLVDFADGSTLVAADLDTNAKQSIYTQQELDDSLVDGLAGVIPNGDKGDITTSVNGSVWTIDNGAVVEAKIGTGAVTEAKIGTGAVSAGKIAAGAFTDSVSSTSTTTIATPNSVKTAYDLATTANTTANAALPKAGGTMTGVITYATAQPRLVRATAVASTSGTAIDLTGIPSWANRVTVVLDRVSCNNAGSNLLIQLGTSSGVETTGYLVYGSANYYSSTSPGEAQSSFASGAGFISQFGIAESFRSGLAVFANVTENRWIGNLNIGAAANVPSPPANVFGSITTGGSKELSGVLDRVRITWDVTATFDLGNINIIYEG